MHPHCRKDLAYYSLLLLTMILAGCAAITGPLDPPRISIADIQVQEVKTMETVFLVELRILNPNDAPLNVQGVTCDLEIDGRHFATGIASGRHQIPAYGTALVPVSVYASMLDMVTSFIQRIQAANTGQQAQPMEYTLHGKVRLDHGGMQKNLPFESSGALSLEGLAPNG